MSPQPPQVRLSHRIAVGLFVFLLLLLAGLATARAGEFVPSVGYSKTPESAKNQMIYGLSLRGGGKNRMVSELAINYRNEDYAGGDMSVRTIPVTLSAWASPFHSFYMGGGWGYYYMDQKYRENLGLSSRTAHDWGYHLGGGMRIPMGRQSALDMQYRRVRLDRQNTSLPGGSFDPSFWSVSAGIAMRY